MDPLSLVRSRGFAIFLALVSTIFVGAGLTYFYFVHPHLLVGPRQPIPFSHRLHAGVKEIDCRFCHASAGHTPHAGIPSPTKCLYCHKYIIPSHPYIRQVSETAANQLHELAAYGAATSSIRWRKVTWLPDHVYFSHQRHIRKNVECQSCHGPIETMDRVYEVNRLTMGFCLECHRERNASLDCWACHQ